MHAQSGCNLSFVKNKKGMQIPRNNKNAQRIYAKALVKADCVDTHA